MPLGHEGEFQFFQCWALVGRVLDMLHNAHGVGTLEEELVGMSIFLPSYLSLLIAPFGVNVGMTPWGVVS